MQKCTALKSVVTEPSEYCVYNSTVYNFPLDTMLNFCLTKLFYLLFIFFLCAADVNITHFG